MAARRGASPRAARRSASPRAALRPKAPRRRRVAAERADRPRHPAFDFAFKVSCACKDHPRYPHLLSLSSLLFIPAAQRVLAAGAFYLGALAAALAMTSSVYHATHSPCVRAADILVLWLTGSTGFLKAIAAMLTRGANGWLACGILGILALCAIFQMPVFYIDGDRNGKATIKLHWHVAVHAIAAAGLICFAVGDPQPALITEAQQRSAWIAAAVGAAVLVLIASIVHEASLAEERRASSDNLESSRSRMLLRLLSLKRRVVPYGKY